MAEDSNPSEAEAVEVLESLEEVKAAVEVPSAPDASRKRKAALPDPDASSEPSAGGKRPHLDLDLDLDLDPTHGLLAPVDGDAAAQTKSPSSPRLVIETVPAVETSRHVCPPLVDTDALATPRTWM
jgi:hypothetical protein